MIAARKTAARPLLHARGLAGRTLPAAGAAGFAAALGPRGIRVNAVAPGVVETDMSSFAKTDAGRDFTLGMQALTRVA